MSSSSVPPPQNDPQRIQPVSSASESGQNYSNDAEWLLQANTAITHEADNKAQEIEQKMAAFIKENQLGDYDPQVQHALFYINQNKGPQVVADIRGGLDSDTSHSRIDAAIQSINDTDPNGPQFPLLGR